MVGALVDIVATWPKSRPLESYLVELKRAERAGQVVNFRVAALPKIQPVRCYMVHTGFVRGCLRVIDMRHRDDVIDPTTGQAMRPGFYIVREPIWTPIPVIPMKGFQGWRHFDEGRARAAHN